MSVAFTKAIKTLPGLLAVMAAIAATVSAVVWSPPKPETVVGDAMRIDFGYGKAALTRSLTYDVCSSPDGKASFPECQQDATRADIRPEITSVAVAADLSPVDTTKSDRCAPVAGRTFPARQIAATATNFDVRSVRLNVSADPAEPEAVDPGTYCGTLLVTRTGSPLIEVPLLIDLRDRWTPAILWRVFVALILGSAVGAFLKWVGDHVQVSTGASGSTRRSDRSGVTRHSGLILGAATALAVALSGAGSQFFDNATFSNRVIDYFTLVIWAFTGQLAGQTLIDIAGNAKAAGK